MKRIFFILPLALLLLSAASCATAKESLPTEEYSYYYNENETTAPPVTLPPASSAAPTTLPPVSEASTAMPPVSEVPTTLPPVSEVPTTLSPATVPTTETPVPSSAVPTSSAGEFSTDENGNIDLHVELPDANGTMVVSTEKSNAYIRIVSEQRGLNTNLLIAVYTVPQTWQNYVVEFKNAESRTADGIRRVYLIDQNDKIVSVAAAADAEKENCSTTENWFCMNVLIKKMIFPKIEPEIQ